MRDRTPCRQGVSPVIATILLVTITVILAAVLYVMVTGPIGLDRDRPEILGPVVAGSGTESVIIIASVLPGKLPESTPVLIRDANVLLARTRFSALTSANWTTYHVRYDDASPADAEVAPSDRIIVNRGHYPPPIILEISDGIRILATQSLWPRPTTST